MNLHRLCWMLAASLVAIFLIHIPSHAQYGGPKQVLTRSYMWSTFWNFGGQGRQLNYSKSEHQALNYPGRLIRGPEMDGNRNWRYQWNTGWAHRPKVSSRYTNSVGEGIWIMTNLNGDIHVSTSGPRVVSDDIKMMWYDPANKVERDLGYGNEYGKDIYEAMDVSNYWPGAAPQSNQTPVEIKNYRYYKYMDPDKTHWPEEMVIQHWTTKNGITATAKNYAWSFPGYNHFYIKEFIFENTGDTTGDGIADIPGGGHQLNDTYFTVVGTFTISESGYDYRALYSHLRMNNFTLDDHVAFTEASNYAGPPEGRGLKLLYQWDGDYPLLDRDTEGQPYVSAIAFAEVNQVHQWPDGMFQSFPYVGVAPLAVGTSDLPFNSRDAAEGFARPKEDRQPYSVRAWQIHSSTTYDEPTSARHSDAEMYQMLTERGWMDNPSETSGWTNTQTYGPYDLAPGDKVKIVVAYVGGAGSQFAGPGGTEMDFLEWMLGPGLGNKASLRRGADAIVANTKAAIKLYRDYEYDLPKPPPDIAITVVPNPLGNFDITWAAAADDAINPDYTGAEAKDVAGYRVFRATRGNLGPWRMIADIKVKDPDHYDPNARWLRQDQVFAQNPVEFDESGMYRFSDGTAQAGFGYVYSVRAYSHPHANWKGQGPVPSLMGGHSGESQTHGQGRISPVVPSTAETDRLERRVRVVPNPFRQDDIHNYPGDLKIRFVNLPQKCNIYITTVSGELVDIIYKDDPNTGEYHWRQVGLQTEGGRLDFPSGLYFFVVESLMPESLGKMDRGSFVLIR